MKNRPFTKSLESGHQAERAWVEAVRSDGLSVAHGRRVQRDKYVPDTRCQVPDAAGLIRIELKQRDLRFTGPDDFPYDTAFVCNCSRNDTDITQPLIYILISAPTKSWVWVLATDRDETWTVSNVRDSTRGSIIEMLSCPKTDLRHAESLKPYLLHHDLLHLIDGNTTAFLRSEEDPRAGKISGGPESRDRKTSRKAR